MPLSSQEVGQDGVFQGSGFDTKEGRAPRSFCAWSFFLFRLGVDEVPARLLERAGLRNKDLSGQMSICLPFLH